MLKLLVFVVAVLVCGHDCVVGKGQLEILNEHSVEQANKGVVMRLIENLTRKQDLSVVDEHFSPDFIQHDPSGADGVAGAKEYIRAMIERNGSKTKAERLRDTSILRVAADGDLVFVHVKRSGLVDGGGPWSAIHILRMQEGRIAEHWANFAQLTPEIVAMAKNPHPFF